MFGFGESAKGILLSIFTKKKQLYPNMECEKLIFFLNVKVNEMNSAGKVNPKKWLLIVLFLYNPQISNVKYPKIHFGRKHQ
jgi:hypothetical protein